MSPLRNLVAEMRRLSENSLRSLTEQLRSLLEAKAFPIGTVRDWAQGPMTKTAKGWVPTKKKRGVAPRLKKGIDKLIQDALTQKSWKNWYSRNEKVADAIFGEDAKMVQGFLAATSQATKVGANVTQALKAYSQYIKGEEFKGFLPGVRKNLDRVVKNEPLAGYKISAYQKALAGDPQAAPVDRHIAQLFFGTSKPGEGQKRKATETMTKMAKKLGWTPREVQSALWAFNQVRKGTPAAKIESYDAILEKREAEVRKLVQDLKG